MEFVGQEVEEDVPVGVCQLLEVASTYSWVIAPESRAAARVAIISSPTGSPGARDRGCGAVAQLAASSPAYRTLTWMYGATVRYGSACVTMSGAVRPTAQLPVHHVDQR